MLLADLGGAKERDFAQDTDNTGMYTPAYAPVEQCLPIVLPQDTSVDVHALAVVVYEVLTGRLPQSTQNRHMRMSDLGHELYGLARKGRRRTPEEQAHYAQLRREDVGALFELAHELPLMEPDHHRLRSRLEDDLHELEGLTEPPHEVAEALLTALVPRLEDALQPHPRGRAQDARGLLSALQQASRLLPDPVFETPQGRVSLPAESSLELISSAPESQGSGTWVPDLDGGEGDRSATDEATGAAQEAVPVPVPSKVQGPTVAPRPAPGAPEIPPSSPAAEASRGWTVPELGPEPSQDPLSTDMGDEPRRRRGAVPMALAGVSLVGAVGVLGAGLLAVLVAVWAWPEGDEGGAVDPTVAEGGEAEEDDGAEAVADADPDGESGGDDAEGGAPEPEDAGSDTTGDRRGTGSSGARSASGAGSSARPTRSASAPASEPAPGAGGAGGTGGGSGSGTGEASPATVEPTEDAPLEPTPEDNANAPVSVRIQAADRAARIVGPGCAQASGGRATCTVALGSSATVSLQTAEGSTTGTLRLGLTEQGGTWRLQARDEGARLDRTVVVQPGATLSIVYEFDSYDLETARLTRSASEP